LIIRIAFATLYAMNIKKQHYLNALGIETWQLRTSQTNAQRLADPLETLHTAVTHRTACPLHTTLTQTVFGTGNPHADLMIINATGSDDDKKGEPFVGLEGLLLNAMLQSIGISREQVYLTTILKYHLPPDRDPSLEEINLCTPFLEKQIELVHPKLILSLGHIATCYLLKTNVAFEELRGKCNTYYNIPLLVSHHPSYLLKNPKEKRHAFADLQLVSQLLQKKM
jgi:uracil-DNA glycosylase family 4